MTTQVRNHVNSETESLLGEVKRNVSVQMENLLKEVATNVVVRGVRAFRSRTFLIISPLFKVSIT